MEQFILANQRPLTKNDKMFTLTFLSKENDLNKILRNQKRSKNTINLLFVSLWDQHCTDLINKIRENYSESQGEDLYIIDSFNMPHSFVIYEVTKTPGLVILRKDKPTYFESYLPRIYEYFNIK
jgi:hypothetical protein